MKNCFVKLIYNLQVFKLIKITVKQFNINVMHFTQIRIRYVINNLKVAPNIIQST